MHRLPFCIGAVLTLAFSSVYSATTLITDSYTGKLLGASNVLVGANLYDVQFIDGTCAYIFGGCNSQTGFTFDTAQSARLASAALFDHVLLGTYDARPELTSGCSSIDGCNIYTPFKFDTGLNRVYAAPAINFRDPNVWPFYDTAYSEVNNAVMLLDPLTNLSSNQGAVWAAWTIASSQNTPTPPPPSELYDQNPILRAFKVQAQKSVDAWDQNDLQRTAFQSMVGTLGGMLTPSPNFGDLASGLVPFFLKDAGLYDQNPRLAQFASDAIPTLWDCATSGPHMCLFSTTMLTTDWITIPVMRKIAQDPPDNDFQSIVELQVPIIVRLPTSGDQSFDDLMRQFQDANALASALMKALNISFDRYSAAYAAGDLLAAAAQLRAMEEFAERARLELIRLGDLFSLTSSYLVNLGFNLDANVLDGTRMLQSVLATEGLSIGFEELYLNWGLSQGEIDAAVSSLLAFTPSGESSDALRFFDSAASAFRGFDYTVSEPSALLLIALGLLSLMGVRHRRIC